MKYPIDTLFLGYDTYDTPFYYIGTISGYKMDPNFIGVSYVLPRYRPDVIHVSEIKHVLPNTIIISDSILEFQQLYPELFI